MITDNQTDLINFEGELERLLLSPECTHGLARALRRLKKELYLYTNYSRSLKKFPKRIIKINYDKLQIGGGKHLLPGFFNIDIIPPADLIWDIRENIPLQKKSVKYIFSEHFFEHLDYPKSAKFFIDECYRILNDSGQIVLGMPDSELVLKAYYLRDKKLYNKFIFSWYKNRDCLKHFNTYIDLVNYHLRDQDDNEKYNPHYWGYDYEKLYSMLIARGFKNISKWQFDNTIANPKRKFGSIYITAFK